MDSSSSIDVSIIILNYKSENLVRYCLRSIRENLPTCSCEILVVDNQSEQPIEKILEKEKAAFAEMNIPLAIIGAERNLGYAGGNNLGIKESRGRFLLILNPDIILFPKAVDALLAFLQSHPRAALVAPRLVNADRSLQYSCYRFPRLLIPLYRRTRLGRFAFARRALEFYLMQDDPHATSRTVDWVLGACLLLRKEAIVDVGKMDERFFLYFEDVDWCRRFWEKGWEVWYEPMIELVHYHHRESHGKGIWSLLQPATRAHLISWFRYFWKYQTKRLPLRPHV